jgi:hypothetical protein
MTEDWGRDMLVRRVRRVSGCKGQNSTPITLPKVYSPLLLPLTSLTGLTGLTEVRDGSERVDEG